MYLKREVKRLASADQAVYDNTQTSFIDQPLSETGGVCAHIQKLHELKCAPLILALSAWLCGLIKEYFNVSYRFHKIK